MKRQHIVVAYLKKSKRSNADGTETCAVFCIIHCFTHWKALCLCRSRNRSLRYMMIFVRNSLPRGCLPTRSLLSMKPIPKCEKRSCSLKSVPARFVSF